MYKKIIPYINCEKQLSLNIIEEAVQYETAGADEIFVYNYSTEDDVRDEFLGLVKDLAKKIDIPINIGCFVKRFEDVKKALYTGASFVTICYDSLKDQQVIKESVERFGKDKIIIEIENYKTLYEKEFMESLKKLGVYAVLLKQVELSSDLVDTIKTYEIPVIIKGNLTDKDASAFLKLENIMGITTNYYKNKDLFKAKSAFKAQNIEVNTFESSINFEEFKLNSDGMLPVVVQDYKTSEVLMVAYMNKEAYQKTIETGKMTYFSRSRQNLWVKGETSGHYQYVKSLKIDCDKDTILAKVLQIGPACHTGSQTCFFTDLVKKEYDDTNPLTVFDEVFKVIMDRKQNPKEGSYTNYLFDKGIDKILKKCGEEATEIIIAAKNPDSEELKYEISDFLYHMMVLMAECNLEWSDIVKELAHRR